MVPDFDERLDYQGLKVESGGVTLQEGRDYTMKRMVKLLLLKMTPEYIKANSSAEIM